MENTESMEYNLEYVRSRQSPPSIIIELKQAIHMDGE